MALIHCLGKEVYYCSDLEERRDSSEGKPNILTELLEKVKNLETAPLGRVKTTDILLSVSLSGK